MRDRLTDYIRAGFAGIYLLTREEVRAEAELRRVADTLGYGLHCWSLTRGLLNTATGSVEPILDPVDAVNALSDLPEKSILALSDYHQFLGDPGQPASPLVTRTLKDRLREARATGQVIVVVGCALNLPPELAKEFTVLEHELPGPDVLAVVAESIAEEAHVPADAPTVEAAAEAARGLSTTEAEDVFALSVVRARCLDPVLVATEKARAIGQGGLLELHENPAALDDIGGLDRLKGWLLKRRRAFTHAAAERGLPAPRGVLILGIPGTGKSLTATATAVVLQRPLLKLDAGRLFGGLVGESEANLRRALRTAEAIAPCVLLVDEIEKGLAGGRSGETDGGTAARVLGSLLTWLQDKTAPVFVVATANDVSRLPPELLRAGRFDACWFVELPGPVERYAIWRIHLAKRGLDADAYDVEALAVASDRFTGAEIEQAVVDALFEAFDKDTPVTQADLEAAVRGIVPLATTMAEDITRLRDWARHRARPASTTADRPDTGRRVQA